MVQMVKRATARMDRLVRDMLEVGRLEAGHTLPVETRCVGRRARDPRGRATPTRRWRSRAASGSSATCPTRCPR